MAPEQFHDMVSKESDQYAVLDILKGALPHIW
jgi:hypothetical protein